MIEKIDVTQFKSGNRLIEEGIEGTLDPQDIKMLLDKYNELATKLNKLFPNI